MKQERWDTDPEGFAHQLIEMAVSLRFVQNAFNMDLAPKPDRPVSPEEPDAALVQAMQGWAEGVEKHPATPVERYLQFRRKILRCNAASDQLEGPDAFTMEYRTLSEDRWVAVEIRPSIGRPH